MHAIVDSKSIRFLLVLLWSISTTGCALLVASAVVGVGSYTYHQGELKRGYQTNYDAAVQASVNALKTLDIRMTGQRNDPLETILKGEYFNGKPITITITRKDPAITDIGIRSGFVGFWDKEFSEKIHEEIQKNLQQS